MSISENLKFIKGVSAADVAKMRKTSQENYQSLKDDTNNFTDESFISVVPEIEETLELWVQAAKKQGITSSSSSKTSKAPKAKKEKTAKAPKAKKEKAVSPKKTEMLAKLKEKSAKLRDEVKANAKFKDKLGNELTAFLRKNPISLGASPIDMEIEKEKQKIKFYQNLLKGDVADFKGIAQRVGIEVRKLKLPKNSNFSTRFPFATKKPMYNDGTPLSGLGAKKKRKTTGKSTKPKAEAKPRKKREDNPTRKQLNARNKIVRISKMADKIQQKAGYTTKTVKVAKMNRKDAVKKASKIVF